MQWLPPWGVAASNWPRALWWAVSTQRREVYARWRGIAQVITHSAVGSPVEYGSGLSCGVVTRFYLVTTPRIF